MGNPVFYVGAETGRDGFAGAAFASRDLTEESKEDRPAVQVGDPFSEKLLLEACLELLASGCVAGIQDMGAAGLTCSTCETASRGGTGVEIDLSLVPKRETGMTPYEILLSESQERMLVIVKKGEEVRVQEIFEKWDLPYAQIGIVTGDGFMRVQEEGQTVVEIPARALADEAPVYHREASQPPPPAPLDLTFVQQVDVRDSLIQLSSIPVSLQSAGLAPVRPYGATWLRGPTRFGCRRLHRKRSGQDPGRHFGLQRPLLPPGPERRAKIAVAEAAAIDLLRCRPACPHRQPQFRNPYKPENFLQLREAVKAWPMLAGSSISL